jgi:hypothetical protein
MIIAKQIENNKDGTSLYELYSIEIIKDINDDDVTVPRLIGIYNLKFLQDQVVFIQEEIDAINALPVIEPVLI